jgi:hypothetical protein
MDTIVIEHRYSESEPGEINATLVDASQTAIPGSDVSSVLLTIWDVDSIGPAGSPTNGIINDRLDVDVLASNEIAIGEDGAYTLRFSPADHQIANPRKQVERHWVKLQFAYTTLPASFDGIVISRFEVWVDNLP